MPSAEEADHPPTPTREARPPRRPGRLAGQVWIAPDFDPTPEEIITAFEEEPDSLRRPG
ncbi:hypothetical protein [Candidatus Poriferisocius sp.]|uniref:hypothetical protein n=1 Tax=Candidatus Poriferisocius sp. TaxID=3101276 RepID=UPI003B5A126A